MNPPAAAQLPGTGPNSEAAPVPPPDRRLVPAICFFLVLAVWIVFGQTLHHQFVNYDDDVYVYDNPVVTQGLNWHGVGWAFTHEHGSNWHPATWISHMLDCQLYGLNPGGHHLTNVLLHMATVILLFLVLRELTGATWRSAFVAAVFAIHPLRAESVAWVAERKDVLSGLFFMLTLWAYGRYARRARVPDPKARVWYGLALGGFALGLMSKPMLVTLPFVLLLLDCWPLQRVAGWQRLLREKVPFLLLTAAACVVTILAQENAIKSVRDFGWPARISNALAAYVAYLWQMFWPAGLAPFYPHPRNSLPVWNISLSALVLAAISAGVGAGRRRHPYLLVGWLWYLGMLVPVIGLIQVGGQAHADRYTYLPQIGLYVAIAWGMVELCGSWRHRRVVLGSAAAAIIAILMADACVQTRYWKDSISLWTHTLDCTPGNYLAHNNLGNVLTKREKLPEAVAHYERALQLNPDYIDAHNNLGVALAKQEKYPEAIRHYQRALQLNPEYADAHNNLGIVLAKQENYPEAIQHYQRALQLNPDYVDAHNNLGVVLAKQGKLDEAIEHYQRALQLNPDYANAHNNLGAVLVKQGKLPEALRHYERALQLNPEDADTHFNLGNALTRQGKLDEAIQHYERALQLNPEDAQVHCNLGVVLFGQGRLDEAILHCSRAVELKPDYADAQVDLGVALTKKGRLDEARQHYQLALKLAIDQHNSALAEAVRTRLNALPRPGGG